jgi:dolichol-phosphate mannosyltransferase
VSRVVVVIPTFNEAENLPLIVPKVLEQDSRFEVLVVDDDSPDGTGKVADDFAAATERVHVLHREGKRGLGIAYREGLRRALELGADYVAMMDADFSHPVETLSIFLEEIESHDVVLGSRYLKGVTVVNWPIERILLSYFGNLYVRKITGLPISDTTGGFRLIRAPLLERIGFERIRSEGYSFQIELNYRFWKYGARMKEVQFFFLDRTRGESKLTLSVGLETLWIVWWLRVANLLGRI